MVIAFQRGQAAGNRPVCRLPRPYPRTGLGAFSSRGLRRRSEQIGGARHGHGPFCENCASEEQPAMKPRKILPAAAGVAAALCALAPVSYHRMRPGYTPGLPAYEYTYGTVSAAVSVFSLDPLPLARVDAAPGLLVRRDRLKVFQLSRPEVKLDHCSLSRVAVTLQENGEWILSLRADQNAWMTGPQHEVSTPTHLAGAVSARRPPIPNLPLETEGLKRNQFIVKVRCYGAFKIFEKQPAANPGKPVLFELPTALFWVQRGVPYDLYLRQSLPAVAQFYDVVDRVEVEFSYR